VARVSGVEIFHQTLVLVCDWDERYARSTIDRVSEALTTQETEPPRRYLEMGSAESSASSSHSALTHIVKTR
jgi:hypothetical protein